MHQYFVYMLHCKDGSYYIGVTNDIERRLEQHQTGWDPHAYTHNRRPVTLVYRAEFQEIMDAIAFEKQLKGWSQKKKSTDTRRSTIAGAIIETERRPTKNTLKEIDQVSMLRGSSFAALMPRTFRLHSTVSAGQAA